jgi:hypothetical protein
MPSPRVGGLAFVSVVQNNASVLTEMSPTNPHLRMYVYQNVKSWLKIEGQDEAWGRRYKGLRLFCDSS